MNKYIVIFGVINILVLSSVLANEKVSIFDGKVQYEISSISGVQSWADSNEWERRTEDVQVGYSIVHGRDYTHRNIESEGSLFVHEVINANYRINSEHIYELLRTNDRVLFPENKKEYYVDTSYKKFYYNGMTIGEQVFSCNAANSTGFRSVHFSIDILFIVDDVLIGIGISYYDKMDTTIMEQYPKLFKKTSRNNYVWRNESSREVFYKMFLTAEPNVLPSCMHRARVVYDTIMETLAIIRTDNVLQNNVGTNQPARSSLKENDIYIVSDNLRLRENEQILSKEIVTMAKETVVLLLKIGRQDVIDGITSNWVQVEPIAGSKDKDGNTIPIGTIGWCFGGYLE